MTKCNFHTRTRNRAAFTLVELLVVIAIIGLLTTIAVVAFSSVRKQARNAKRIADVKQLITAFSLGLDANGSYPAGAEGIGCISTACTGTWSWVPIDNTINGFFTPFTKKPTDSNDSNSRSQGGYIYIKNWVDGGVNFPAGEYIHYELEAPAACGPGALFNQNASDVSCAVKLY